jgi:sortase A
MSTIRAELPTLTLRGGPSAVTVGRALARLTVAVSLLIVGFVAYEFGVTSVMANRAQAGLRDDLAMWEATAPVTQVAFAPADLPAAPVVVPAGLSYPDPVTAPVAGRIVTAPASSPGGVVGRIVITSAGVDWAFVEGVDRSSLRSGVGHMPGTALPGEPGNAVLSGHRTTYGAPFFHLDRVQPGDVITVETATGIHVYQAVEVRTVAPSDLSVTAQWQGAWLTLTTCNPAFSARERLVVIARLVDGPNAAVILAGS